MLHGRTKQALVRTVLVAVWGALGVSLAYAWFVG